MTRSSIASLSAQYDPSRLFVLYDDVGEATQYLGRDRIPNGLYSKAGEISDPSFLRTILEGCEQLTVCGHTQNSCHYEAFEEVVKGYRASGNAGLTIAIPTHAVSSGLGSYTGKPVRDDVLVLERHVNPGTEYPKQLHHYREMFAKGLTPRDIATLTAMLEYVKVGLSQDFSFEIQIDGRTAFSLSDGHARKLVLALQN